jgi:transcription elongation GreA/GreB family factor
MDKPALIRALLEQFAADIERAVEAANRSRHDATHEEARPENDKDTRALESSYLARGQAQRVVDLERAERQVRFMTVRDFGEDEPIDLSALVELESDEGRKWYFVAPSGGGRTLELAGVAVDVITPEAPVGRALIGRLAGEDLELRVGARLREYTIARVR